MLKGIDNPHIVRVASDLVMLGEPPTGAAWLEEYLDGSDLSDLVAQPWEWQHAREMAAQVADGLAALHEAHVVHRDLSANNVRRLSSGDYKVMDPGFAHHTLRSGITFGGQPGTPGFMSPEHLQFYSGAPTASSDVFQVGILLYLVLSSDLPIPYLGDDTDYISRLKTVTFKSLRDARPGLPDGAYELVDRCLHKQPARRFRNGTRLAEAVRSSA